MCMSNRLRAMPCIRRSCAVRRRRCLRGRRGRCCASTCMEWFHGKDGLGDHNYPEPRRKPEAMHAVDAIIETVRANPGITLVTLGPLTNVAMALTRAPEIAANVGRAVVMGGAPCCEGNVTPAA